MEIDIKKIENLSKIRIKTKIKNTILKELAKILNFASRIKNYKLGEDLKVIGSVNNLKNVLREDIYNNKDQHFSFNREIIFDNIPLKEKSYVKVPKVLKAK